MLCSHHTYYQGNESSNTFVDSKQEAAPQHCQLAPKLLISWQVQ